jgi:predicted MarR family transcription regulator
VRNEFSETHREAFPDRVTSGLRRLVNNKLQMMSRLGLIRTTATSEGVRYEVTGTGLHFLREYGDIIGYLAGPPQTRSESSERIQAKGMVNTRRDLEQIALA